MSADAPVAESQPAVTPLESRPAPPLRAGDRLTRDDFLRRYEALPAVRHAELIEGVVYVSPPVSGDHAVPQFTFNGILFVYQWQTPGVEGGDNATVKLGGDNVPQPDAYLRLLPEYGGQSKPVDRFVEGAPELVAEVAASSASYDLHDKLNAYRRNGVQEYVVWRVWDRVSTGSSCVAVVSSDMPATRVSFAVKCFRGCGLTWMRSSAVTRHR